MDSLQGVFSPPRSLTGTLSPPAFLTGTLSPPQTLTGQLTVPTVIGVEAYDGPYEVTPGEQPQRIPVEHKWMREDLIVGAIPSDYGRLSWNGHTLTVY